MTSHSTDDAVPDLHSHDATSADGTRVRLWERAPADAGEAVLFVHGATYGGRAAFDALPGEGYSWLAAAARDGRAAFAVDLRGYGDSDRPADGESGDGDGEAVPARAPAAATDVRAALARVRERFDRVHLVGYSWGTVVCGTLLAGGDAPRVASLTQFAPVFRVAEEVAARFDLGDPPAPYRRVTRRDVAERWNDQIPGDPAAHRGGPGDPVLDAFWARLVESGQGERAEAGDDAIYAPNGTLLDLRESVEADPYAPADIGVPALVARGSLDPTARREDALALYDRLGAGDDRKEYAEVAGGTHFLPLERRRGALYDAVAAFQDRAGE